MRSVTDKQDHLYISKACPWSHRTTIMRTLKGLDTVISTTCMDAFMGEESWQICSAPGSLDTSLSHAAGLIEITACHA